MKKPISDPNTIYNAIFSEDRPDDHFINDINSLSPDDFSPLQVAVLNNRPLWVKWLLEKKANPCYRKPEDIYRAITYQVNYLPKCHEIHGSALSMAIQQTEPSRTIIEQLLPYYSRAELAEEPDLLAYVATHQDVLYTRRLCKAGAILHPSALDIALKKNNLEVVTFLLQAGISLDKTIGQSILDTCINKQDVPCALALCQRLSAIDIELSPNAADNLVEQAILKHYRIMNACHITYAVIITTAIWTLMLYSMHYSLLSLPRLPYSFFIALTTIAIIELLVSCSILQQRLPSVRAPQSYTNLQNISEGHIMTTSRNSSKPSCQPPLLKKRSSP